MEPIVSLNSELLATAVFGEADSRVVYDPYPVSQSGQNLDLTQDKVKLSPDRILLNFELIDPVLREHVKAWISFACKNYSNISLSNQFKLLKKLSLKKDSKNEDAICESIDGQFRDYMQGDNHPSTKSVLRMIYGWFVQENFPFFDEDFYDLYLDTIKFGSDEGKGKDVILKMENRGPLTLYEQRIFRQKMDDIDVESLSIYELQGMVALKIGQVLGARDTQVIKLKFKHIGIANDKVPFILLPRAKQRGRQKSEQYKKRAVTKSLFDMLVLLKSKYEDLVGEQISDNWPVICTHQGRTGKPRDLPVTRDIFMIRRLAFEDYINVGFKVTNRRLRKTFCTQLIAKGTPLKIVAELMDHTDLQQLEVYYRHTHHVANKLNEVLKSEASEVIDAFKGKVIKPEQASQAGQQIFAPSGTQQLHLIGSCSSKSPCPLNPPLSCYGCKSLEAFEDADHEGVVNTFLEETRQRFGEKHAIEILKHDDFLAAREFLNKRERGEL